MEDVAQRERELIEAQRERNQQKTRDQFRRRLEQHARNIDVIDGSVRDQLREWIDAVTNAQRWTLAGDDLIVEMVGYLSKGALRNAIAAYIQQVVLPALPTWIGAVEHISRIFLDEDETKHLRTQAEQIKQSTYMDTREYALKYEVAICKAYTPAELVIPLVQERIVETFIRGLREIYTRTHTYQSNPQTLKDAIHHANSASRTLARTRAASGDGDEPMDISVIPKTASTTPDAKDDVAELKQMMRGLQTQVNQLSHPAQWRPRSTSRGPAPDVRGPVQSSSQWNPRRPPPSRTSSTYKFGKPAYNADGTPNCFGCGRAGHLARDCRRPRVHPGESTKKRASPSAVSGNA